MKVAITGATGFIGRHLARHLVSAGHEVVGLCRRPPVEPSAGIDFYSYDLGDSVPAGALQECSILIHCAHVLYSRRQPAADELNVEGAQRIFEAAEKAGVAKILYFSSLSAHAGVQSHYAASKLAVEGLLDPERDLILRLGMVLGPGGLAKRMLQVLQGSRLVPLVDGGRQPVHTIHIADLCRLVQFLAQTADSGILEIGHPQALTLAEVNRALARALRRRVLFVPIPFHLVSPLVGLAERLGFELPVSVENLEGLRAARSLDPSRKHLDGDLPIRSFEELVETGALEEWIDSPPSGPSIWARLLKPRDAEMLAYARRETDWQQAPRFRPLTRGPLVALLVLAGVGLVAALTTPLRMARRLLEQGE